MGVQKANTDFKANNFPKKGKGRKRIFSTIEPHAMFDHKYSRFSGNLSNTKDSSTSSNNKFCSPFKKGMSLNQAQEIKSPYLIKLRKCIKDKEEDNLTIKDLKGHVSEIAMDQVGSRFIQKMYETNCKNYNEKLKDMIEEIREDSITVMKDVFGNYVIQKILEFGPEIHIQILFNEIKGNILEMSQHMYGCRVVQKFIEVLKPTEASDILKELEGNVLNCIYDQYGNHVIQKIISTLKHIPFKIQTEGATEEKVECFQKILEENSQQL